MEPGKSFNHDELDYDFSEEEITGIEQENDDSDETDSEDDE